MGRTACAIRGPRSRAGLIAYPVVPPSERPITQTKQPTRYGPSPGAIPLERALEKIAPTTNTSTNVPMISLMRLANTLRIAGAENARAKAEGDRQLSEEKFQKVFRSSPIPFSITTLKEGRFLDVNAAFERRYGYAREEALGHTVHELRIWEDPADRVLMIEQLQRGGPIRNVITRLRTKSGELKLTAYSADRIQFDGQSCILAVSEDLPEYDKGKVN
jgi:PAS domain S-box-containing protein